MKNNKLIAALLAIFLVISCTTELPDEVAPVLTEGSSITLDIATPASRVELGERSGESYPLYWSVGDRISINGSISNEAQISAEDPRSATFEFSAPFNYPASILYPASTDGTIEFPAMQSYSEGSFNAAAAPMYGYANGNSKCEMQHLYSALCFSFTGSATLVSMDIRAEKGALAGRYTVDCTTGALSNATATSDTIAYSFGDGLALSDKVKKFYVTLPAGDHGTCSIVLRDKSGSTMRLRFSATGDQILRRGVVREFQIVKYVANAEAALKPLESEEDVLDVPLVAHGFVLYDDGSPAAGVAVSDGFSVSVTGRDGYYRITPSSDCYYIFISLPADCEIPTDEYGHPCFYKRHNKNTLRYDFTLKRLKGGAEDKFALYTIADPHVVNATRLTRFNKETVPMLKAHSTANPLPCYGITLGDMVSSSTAGDKSSYMSSFRTATHIDKTGFPMFEVMGNHDMKGNTTVAIDENNSTLELAAQRTYEDHFGPANYSFNRGKVHIVGMRDVIFRFTTYGANEFDSYTRGFSKEQYEWLRRDLAAVPKDHFVILCVHIPLSSHSNKSTYYVRQVYDLLAAFAGSHVLSGHSHNITNTKASTHSTTEQVLSSVCGAWWSSTLCTSGAPNGFAVYEMEGNRIADHYFQGVNEGQNDRYCQMRVYRGSMITGGAYEYFASPYSDKTIVAHVWNSTEGWDVRVYLDGKELGKMTRIARYKGDPWAFDANGGTLTDADYDAQESIIKAQTSTSNPTRFMDNSSVDWYCAGYHIGVKSRPRSDNLGANSYLYKLESDALAKADWSKVKVVAIDDYDTRYECNDIFQGVVGVDFDYSLATAPSW